VSVDLTVPPVRTLCLPVGRRAARSERRRLARHDRVAAQLAELHCIRALVGDAITVVRSGWVQHDWFAVAGQHGEHRVSAYDIHLVTSRPVSGACLVGAIVHAGGGPTEVRSQVVQRTLDLTWHTLHEDRTHPVQWCPSPPTRTAHVRDLTRWNDHPDRTADDVTALLRSAIHTAQAQTNLLHARHSVGTAS
jgi:hypothetical protein